MEYLIICLVTFFMSGISVFSGFGLGTVLLPVLAIFFPLITAISFSAIIHLFSNVFKLFIWGRHADRRVVLLFGLPALAASAFGAQALSRLSAFDALLRYELMGSMFEVTPLKLTVSLLIGGFTVFELWPQERISWDKKYLPIGGALSGFLGGLSGHQGALRSAFLIKSGLGKESFIGTNIVLSCLVDVTRVIFYGMNFPIIRGRNDAAFLAGVIIAAILGITIAVPAVKKITVRFIQNMVASMLLIVAVLLGLGII